MIGSCGVFTFSCSPEKTSKETKVDFEKQYETRIVTEAVNVRAGPGANYEKDEGGPLIRGEKVYVLEEKDGWIRFRVTPKDVGWSGWIKKDYTVTPEQYAAEPPLKIEDWKWKNESTLGWIIITGYVKNQSYETFPYARIIITAKDENGNWLGNGDAYLDPETIGPGGTSNFHVSIPDAQCTTDSLSITYKFDLE